MDKWKITCGCLAVIILFLAVIIIRQNQHVERELLKDYILQHSTVEQSLGMAIDEPLNARQLSDALTITYGSAMAVYHKPANIYRLYGTTYNSSDYLYEIKDQFDFYLPIAVKEAIDASGDGEIPEAQYQKLLGYFQLLQEFNDLTITDDFGEKTIADFEKDFETFYLNNKEEISALIN